MFVNGQDVGSKLRTYSRDSVNVGDQLTGRELGVDRQAIDLQRENK